jgi:hypothetical protein
MKTVITFFSAIILITLSVQADDYVKGILHVDGGYRWGQNVPENNAVYEWWFAKDKVTLMVTGWRLQFLNTDRRLTFDIKKNRVIAVDLIKKTFVEIPLKMNPLSQIDTILANALKRFKMFGMVKKTGIKKTLQLKKCEEYLVQEWILKGDIRYFQRDRKVMATTDVSFDWRLLDKLYEWIRSFFNPRESYSTELKKINGFVLTEDGTIYESAGDVTYNFKVKEISQLQPPPGIYNVPTGFHKKNHFSRRDLLDIRDLLYPWPLQ